MRWTIRILLAVACVGVTGCALSLLPSSRTEDVSPFASFEAARDAIEKVVPYQTTSADLKARGFDLNASANIQMVPYPQWVGMLVQSNVPLERADKGIRDCLAAEKDCRAYVFRFSNMDRDRSGDFLADFLNFRRLTLTHGWRFEGTLLVSGDLVVFRNYGGEPKVELVDDRVNPLGPFQGVGETLPSKVIP